VVTDVDDVVVETEDDGVRDPVVVDRVPKRVADWPDVHPVRSTAATIAKTTRFQLIGP
jgi:hypothetical protein